MGASAVPHQAGEHPHPPGHPPPPPHRWLAAALIVCTVLLVALTGVVVWLAATLVHDESNRTQRLDSFCQYLLTQEAVSAQHEALAPLVPAQQAALVAEGCVVGTSR